MESALRYARGRCLRSHALRSVPSGNLRFESRVSPRSVASVPASGLHQLPPEFRSGGLLTTTEVFGAMHLLAANPRRRSAALRRRVLRVPGREGGGVSAQGASASSEETGAVANVASGGCAVSRRAPESASGSLPKPTLHHPTSAKIFNESASGGRTNAAEADFVGDGLHCADHEGDV
jgi:hypothetical protein